MRRWLVLQLLRLVEWLDPSVDTGRLPRDVSTAADRIVLQAQKLSASGEYKRHWAYARLVKQCPNASHLDASLAIEQSVRRLQ
jgi:hypothetical protein